MSILDLFLATSRYEPSLYNKYPVETRASLDVTTLFKTSLYEGNSTARTIQTDIDLATDGGLIMLFNRESASSITFFDSVRGWNYSSISTSRNAQVDNGSNLITSVSTTGVSIGSSSTINASGIGFAMYSFKKAPRFLDIITFSGDNTENRQINHNLTIKPGFIIVKKLNNLSVNQTDSWHLWHAYCGVSYFNDYADKPVNETGSIFTNTPPDDSKFFIGSTINKSGSDYIAYVFADDRSDTGVIRAGVVFNKGSPKNGNDYFDWESQFLIEKHLDLVDYTINSKWNIKDNSRGMGLLPLIKNFKDTTAEMIETSGTLIPENSGVIADGGSNSYVGSLYQYLAIRKPDLLIPSSGSDVLYIENVTQRDAQKTSNSPFEPDLVYFNTRALTPSSTYMNNLLIKNYSTGSEANPASGFQTNVTNSYFSVPCFFDRDGKNISLGSGWDDPSYGGFIYYLMRRAKGFLDIVNYKGVFLANTKIRHKLQAVPELIIVKPTNSTGNYIIYVSHLGTNYYLQLASTAAKTVSTTVWSNTSPTDEFFTVGNLATVNTADNLYTALVFGSLAGISKVGVYTGNGTNQDIDCGFTSGARFILIKAHNATGNWTLHDTVRGIIVGNDVYNNLNTTAAEVKNRDSIAPLSNGFNVVQNTTSNLNVSARLYMYLAIA